MSSLLKLIFIMVFIPFVHAEQPATTQSPENAAKTLSTVQDEGPASTPVPAAKTEEKRGFEEHFSLGTQNYQAKKYEEAIQHFEKALALHPESAAVLTDLGLSYFQLKKMGLSVAMLRRALFIEPSQPVAEAALTYVLSQLEVKEIPHQIETYERLRATVLNAVSLNGFHVLSALLLLTAGFLWLRYLGRRRKSIEMEEAPPPTPVIPILLTLGFILAISLTALKIYDLSIPRATIVASKVSAQIAPGEGQNALFDLYEGFEVIVRTASNEWLQVSYPGGLTGWVKKDTVMSTSPKMPFD